MSTPMPTEVTQTIDEEMFGTDRPWMVIVWDDPINTMSYVTMVLQRLFGYNRELAEKLMLQVHNEGKAAVASDTREKAELHVFHLHEYGLWATLEQA